MSVQINISIFQRIMIRNQHLKSYNYSTKLKGHTGCVNAITYNKSGSILASGSDDMKVLVLLTSINDI